LNPETGAALYHSEFNGEEANPFHGSEASAEEFLEKHSESGERSYEGFSLYKARVEKAEDAVEVLTSQSGLSDW